MTDNKQYPPLPDFEEVAQHVYWVSRGYIPRGMLEPIHDLMRAYVDADRAMRAAPQDAEDAIGEALEAVRNFSRDVMQAWPEGGIDGGELQDIALAHGLLRHAEPPTDWDGCNFYERTELIK